MDQEESKSGPAIGEKIKYFRTRAGVSQLDLELSINASSGSVSRIESGKVNPTKETIRLIGLALGVSREELHQLFQIPNYPPTEWQVNQALAEIKGLLESDRMLYLIDDWFRFWAATPKMVSLLNVDPNLLVKLRGITILEVLFDPQYQVRKNLDPDYVKQNLSIELARARAELSEETHGNYLSQITQKLRHTPDFAEIEEMSLKLNEEIYTIGTRVSYLKLGDQKIKVNHARERLKHNPNFEIIELFNPVGY